MLDSWRLTDDDYTTIERSGSKELMDTVQNAKNSGFQLAAIGNPETGQIHHIIAQDKNSNLPKVLTDRPLNS